MWRMMFDEQELFVRKLVGKENWQWTRTKGKQLSGREELRGGRGGERKVGWRRNKKMRMKRRAKCTEEECHMRNGSDTDRRH